MNLNKSEIPYIKYWVLWEPRAGASHGDGMALHFTGNIWSRFLGASPANTSRWFNVGLMLGHSRRLWTNIEPTLGQRFVCSWATFDPTSRCSIKESASCTAEVAGSGVARLPWTPYYHNAGIVSRPTWTPYGPSTAGVASTWTPYQRYYLWPYYHIPELSVLGPLTDQVLPELSALERLTTIYRNCQYLNALLPYTGIVSTWTTCGPSTAGTVSTWVSYGIHVYLRNRIISCGNYW